MENSKNMEFTTKDFEAVGDTIEKQKKVLFGFELLVGGLVVNPIIQQLAILVREQMPKDIRECFDEYMTQRAKEIMSQKKGLDKG